MKKIVVVDIDHTVSDARWRDSMIGVETWDTYHASARYDAPVEAVVDLLRCLHRSVTLIAVTGRTRNHFRITHDWCVNHQVPIDMLLMRLEDDFRPAPIIKKELLEMHIGKNWAQQVMLALEDNEACGEMFIKEGVTVLRPILTAPKKEEDPHESDDS